LLEKFLLPGRVALVTGGAGLLGAQFCQALVEAGARVVVADAEAAAAAALAEQLNRAEAAGAHDHPAALAVPVDVTSPESVTSLVTVTLEAFGRLDILVNSAALDPKFDPSSQAAAHSEQVGQDLENDQPAAALTLAFENYPLHLWNQALAVNLTGMFLCCQAAARPMLAQGKGVIINLCSIYGLVGPDQRLYQREGQPPQFKPVYYSVTKAGVLGLTRYLAAYYAGKNIRVNALTPGGVFNGHDEAFVRAYAARAVLERMADPDELNGALLFLASEASSYMTGANLVVDGGWTAW
jgi:NAD(P)-dependent dehydrogenase (short-subunit alcohol dehydrogenase family)